MDGITFVTGKRRNYDVTERERESLLLKLKEKQLDVVPLSDDVFWVADLHALEKAVHQIRNEEKSPKEQLQKLHDAFQPPRK